VKTHNPEAAGFSEERLRRLTTWMQRYVHDGLLAGILALVARRGQVVHVEKVGLQDITSRKTIDVDTIFRIYSMTKPITSVALMMLFERGLIRLADPVSTFIPEFKNVKVWGEGGKLLDPEREITIHDLLTHTAGLSYGGDEPVETPVDAMYDDADIFRPDIALQEMIRRIAYLPLVHQPGQVWRYSVATDVIGYVVQVVSDMPLADFFGERILEPLGMVDTAFCISKKKVERFATLYAPKEDDSLPVLDEPETSEYLSPIQNNMGGQGLVSTVSDYLRFAQCILNGGELGGVRLLGRKTVELMTSNHLPSHLLPIRMSSIGLPGMGFGLGFGVVLDVAKTGVLGSVGDYGWGGYAETYYWTDPREELIGIMMTQSLPSMTYPLRAEFKTLVNQAMIE
jgi:CubicO group peptidase (beta-lactamase class C family)